MTEHRRSTSATALCLLLLLWLGSCGDEYPPTWPPKAELTSGVVEGSEVELSWPRAQDNDEIDTYQILVDDEVTEEVDAKRLNFRVLELEQNRTYRFAVRAEDNAGNLSPPLELTIKTADRIAPTWPAGAALTFEEQPAVPEIPACNKQKLADLPATVGLTFSWPAATDNVGVTAYRIKKGATVVARVVGDKTSHQLITASPGGTYEVDAGDASGNWSNPLSVTRKQEPLDPGAVGKPRAPDPPPDKPSDTPTPVR